MYSESLNLRLDQSWVSWGLYNTKDPLSPEPGSQGNPDSQEALSSLSKFVKLFYLKAHLLYLHKREHLRDELSTALDNCKHIAMVVKLSPSHDDWCHELQVTTELIVYCQMKLDSQKWEFHTQYRQKYKDFCHEEIWRDQERIQLEKNQIWEAEWKELERAQEAQNTEWDRLHECYNTQTQCYA